MLMNAPRRIGASIADQAAADCELAKQKAGGNPVAERQPGKLSTPTDEERVGPDHKCADPQLAQSGKCSIKVSVAARMNDVQLQAEFARRRLGISRQHARKLVVGGVDEERNAGRRGDEFMK